MYKKVIETPLDDQAKLSSLARTIFERKRIARALKRGIAENYDVARI